MKGMCRQMLRSCAGPYALDMVAIHHSGELYTHLVIDQEHFHSARV